jgi:hypothetical protein
LKINAASVALHDTVRLAKIWEIVMSLANPFSFN